MLLAMDTLNQSVGNSWDLLPGIFIILLYVSVCDCKRHVET